MPPSAPHDDEEEVHVLQADAAAGRKGRLPALFAALGLLVLAGAGAWLALHPELLGKKRAAGAQAPPPAAGNLLGAGWSFETTDAGSAFTFWSMPDDAPACFEVSNAGAHSGALGAVAHPVEAGWCRLQSAQPVPLGAHRGAIELSAWSGTPAAALVLRFEAAGKPAIERVVAAGEGELRGAALVPPGCTDVRAVLQATGEARVDDVSLTRADASAAAGEERLERGAFQVLARGPHLLVFRGDELVLEAPGLSAASAPGVALPPLVARLPGAQGDELALPGGGRGSSRVERSTDADALTLHETLSGLPAGALAVRTLWIGGSLAQAPVGLVSATGFSSFTGDFTVPGVTSLVLGHTQDRLVVELEPCDLSGTRQADGRWLLRSESPVAEGQARTLVLRTNFQEERVAAAQHRDAALAAEQAGQYGEALAQADLVVTKYPHDEEVLAAATGVRSRLVTRLQERLDAIDRDLQDALFLASARRCREVLADCEDAARTWSGSQAADLFHERGRTVEERAATLLEADRARRASALQAVSGSFREAGFTGVADEIDDTLKRWLQPAAGSGP
ncbi:MAG TPA: hypothetical protein VFY71_01655 [Planctomycetota bacterium]|nr:hypothetical protein [Planctomycetota bacterium]